MKAISFLKIATVAAFMLVGLSLSAPVQAAGVGNWNDMARGPTIYQTNRWYTSGNASPFIAPPAGSQVTSFSWVLKLSYYPSGTRAWWVTSSGQWLELKGVSGIYYLNPGVLADQSMHFLFYIQQASTHILTPTVYGGGHQLNVNYSY